MPSEKKSRIKKAAPKKKSSPRAARRVRVAEPSVIEGLAVCEVALPTAPKPNLISRMTVVLNHTVLVSSIAAYVIAFVLAGLSTFSLAVVPSGNLTAATLCYKIGGSQAVNANADGSCPAGYSEDGNPPSAAAAAPTPAPAPAPAPAAAAGTVAPPSSGGAAAVPVGTLGTNLQEAGRVAYGDNPANIGVYIAKFILFFFGALGMMFTIYIFYAGFLWLTAAGEEDKVKKARAIIFHSIFAIAICVMAFTLSNAWLKGLAAAAR